MQFHNRFKKSKKHFLFKPFLKFIKRTYYRFYKKDTFNSFISSILRLLFRYKIFFRFYFLLKKSVNPKLINQFWIIRIGFTKKRNYFPFLKLDSYISNNPFFCSNLRNIPFESESCQTIYIKHFFRYFPLQKFNKLIKTWRKKLIPGGILKIRFKLRNNEKRFEILRKTLNENNFYIGNIDKSDLNIDGNISLKAIKQNNLNINTTSVPLSFKKLNDISKILEQNKDIISDKNRICILGHESKKIKDFLEKININVIEIQIFNNIDMFSNISEDYFDGAIVANYFEYCNFSSNEKTFHELRRVLKPNTNIITIIPEKKSYSSSRSAQFFDKGIFTRILDENNIKFKWINLATSFKLIQVFIKNKYNFPLNKRKTKIFLLGNYSLRYTFLNNARWDSQARAFEKMGFNIRIFDIRDNPFPYLLKKIKMFNPDILWTGGKDAYDFLKKYGEYFKVSKIKVIYWLWDIITPEKFDFDNIIDYMFITSKGEIPLYRRTYNLNKIYYMPLGIMPEIIHRNKSIKEIYDVGFSGQLSSYHPFYKERTEMLNFVKQHFKVKIFKNLYNNLPEYYSRCKIIFGGTPYFKELELYASNRPYIALAGGCCFITNYFKGLEKLAENEKHILWYHNKNELKHLLDKYIYNDHLREEIKINAEKLAKEKHNYKDRLINMLDIINDKTKDFYGFIN
jgi:ubiquinone/menaquinone biosynthesis C-methylase UbiE